MFATPFPTLFTCPRMDMEPADDLPEAEVDEAVSGTEPTPLEDVLFGTSGGMSSSRTSSSSSSMSSSSSLVSRYAVFLTNS